MSDSRNVSLGEQGANQRPEKPRSTRRSPPTSPKHLTPRRGDVPNRWRGPKAPQPRRETPEAVDIDPFPPLAAAIGGLCSGTPSIARAQPSTPSRGPCGDTGNHIPRPTYAASAALPRNLSSQNRNSSDLGPRTAAGPHDRASKSDALGLAGPAADAAVRELRRKGYNVVLPPEGLLSGWRVVASGTRPGSTMLLPPGARTPNRARVLLPDPGGAHADERYAVPGRGRVSSAPMEARIANERPSSLQNRPRPGRGRLPTGRVMSTRLPGRQSGMAPSNRQLCQQIVAEVDATYPRASRGSGNGDGNGSGNGNGNGNGNGGAVGGNGNGSHGAGNGSNGGNQPGRNGDGEHWHGHAPEAGHVEYVLDGSSGLDPDLIQAN